MSFGKLSGSLKLVGDSLDDKLGNLYHVFSTIFINKTSRPQYNGRFIFFDMNKKYRGKELLYPERFMHICSIKDKEEYTIFPCNNDIAYSFCQNKCNHSNALESFSILDRTECPYRMSRIHWIPEIIQLANEYDEDIKAWTKIEFDKKKNKVFKRYIRYTTQVVDYVVILKEEKKMYKFITGFPVFLKRHKEMFDKDYLNYQTKKDTSKKYL